MKKSITVFGFGLAMMIALFFSSCKKEMLPDSKSQSPETNTANEKSSFDIATSQLKIAVVSDIHYMDPSLLTNNAAAGDAFQNYIAADPKLIEYSDPIFRKVIADLKTEKPDILLVPGDLTKDGERVSHESVAHFLDELKSTGIKVFVVPGNHDINNPEARSYNGNNAFPTPIIQAADFSNIYSNFGYGDAIARDPNSLSYVAQPYPGLWIMGIDACKYEENQDIAIVGGRIKSQTLRWMLDRLAEAKERNITVLAMMHHNLIEHYAGQSQLDPGYVVDDWQTNVNTLIAAGLKIIFTGHYHANDITGYVNNGKKLTDIQTGSLVTAPIPYRIIMMKNKELDVSTKYVTSIAASLPGGINFVPYSNQFLSQHLDVYFNYYLTNVFGAPTDVAAFAAPLYRNAIMAHFAGDEHMPPDQRKLIDVLNQISTDLSAPVYSLWTDLGIKDNKTPIKLE